MADREKCGPFRAYICLDRRCPGRYRAQDEGSLVGGPICEPPRQITAQVNRSRLRRVSRLGAERSSRPGLGPGVTRDRSARDEFSLSLCVTFMRWSVAGRKRQKRLKEREYNTH